MSRRPKNNHYHFAEQYSDGHRSRKAKAVSALHLPPRAVFFAVLVLLVFGIVTTTFSANTSNEDTDDGSILISVRNAKVERDNALLSREDDDDFAVTGASYDDLAETGTSVGSTSFYYAGSNNSWALTAMTKHPSGYYSYAAVAAGSTFKVSSSNTSYTFDGALGFDFYGMSGVYTRYTGSDWLTEANTSNRKLYRYNDGNTYPCHDPGDSYDGSGDNFYIKNAGYVLVWYANTDLRENAKPMITVVSSLPDGPVYQVHYGVGNDQWAEVDLVPTTTPSTSAPLTESSSFSCSINLSGSSAYEFEIQKVFSSTYPNRSTIYYKRGNADNINYTTNNMPWTFGALDTDTSHAWLNTTVSGNYVFTLNSTQWYDKKVHLTVTYPSYTVTTTMTDNDGDDSTPPAAAPTPATSTVSTGNSVEVTAQTPNDGYEFLGWDVTSGTVKTGSYSGTALTTRTTTNPLTVYPYGSTATVNLQAVYKVCEYAITYNSDASPATAASGSITNPSNNSVPTGDLKTHGVPYTITSNKFIRTGYTQVGWSTSVNSTVTSGNGFYAFGAVYTANTALTLYPVWELDDPANSQPGHYTSLDPDDPSPSQPKIISTGTMTIGDPALSLSLDQNLTYSLNSDITRSYACSITGPSGSTSSVGTNPSNASTFMKFTADTPGTYTVTVTLTDVSRTNVTNTSNTATATSNTATISVAPNAPIFTITAYNVVDDDRDGTTAETAYKILIGNRYHFSAQVTNPISGYNYTWSTNADFAQNHIVGTGTSITFTNTIVPNTNPREYSINLINYDPGAAYNPDTNPDPRTLADESHNLEQVVLYCRATCNSVSNDSQVNHLFYFIQSLIKTFKYEPMQKIFNMNDQTVTLAAEYNINNNNTFTTDLLFSNDNYNYASALDAPAPGFIESFVNAIRAYLYPTGPKYFYIEIDGVNSMNEPYSSRSETIHTTVGTSDSTADRALYFNNNTAIDLKNYLVMCYYIDGNDSLCYQVAQDRNKGDENNEGRNYRVMLPSDATAVRFGFVANDNDRVRYYGNLSIESGQISGFAVPIYYGYTNQIALSDSITVITANSTSTVGSMQSFSCTAG